VRSRLLLPVFALTLFLGAALLFLLEPMVGKLLTPRLGGTPAVWTTCTLFFQAVLLAGYACAHAAARLGVRRQARWQLVLLLVPLAAFRVVPLGVVPGLLPLAESQPVAGLLLLLLGSVGLPLFAVSTTAPVLQKWFAGTEHPAAGDPYFLYAASNGGSLLALAAYPTVVEPLLTLTDQGRVWCAGYGLLVILTGACAVLLWHSPEPAAAKAAPADGPSLTTARAVRWVLLAFAPSSLMLAATTYLTTDFTSLPLFWVLPLGVYLLTFVLAFARPALRLPAALMPVLVLGLVVLMGSGLRLPVAGVIAAHLLVLFVVGLACHGELARLRPATRHLTAYYLLQSGGGALGGVFNAVVAPLVFSSVLEYPVTLVLVCLLLPASRPSRATSASRLLDLALPLALWGAGFALAVSARVPLVLALAGAVLACLLFVNRPWRFGLGVGAVWLAGAAGGTPGLEVISQERTFFGILTVCGQDGGRVHTLYHGNTLHGGQRLAWDDRSLATLATPLAAGRAVELPAYLLAGRDAWRDPRSEPLTYYFRDSPIGQVHAALPSRRNVGVIGLGTGTLAAYARPGQRLTFYEIDPAVARIAEDPGFFTYLHDARERGVEVEIVLGDARVQLARLDLPHGDRFDLLVVDAFSSDTIPVHLLTREALDLYFDRLAPRGIVAYHITNRHLDLEPVVRNLAESTGRPALVQRDKGNPRVGKEASTWALLARRREDFGSLARDGRWRSLRGRPGVGVWTDDFSNVLSVFRWGS
jgi:hypothetical protein